MPWQAAASGQTSKTDNGFESGVLLARSGSIVIVVIVVMVSMMLPMPAAVPVLSITRLFLLHVRDTLLDDRNRLRDNPNTFAHDRHLNLVNHRSATLYGLVRLSFIVRV
jgi:hypothetical protein